MVIAIHVGQRGGDDLAGGVDQLNLDAREDGVGQLVGADARWQVEEDVA